MSNLGEQALRSLEGRTFTSKSRGKVGGGVGGKGLKCRVPAPTSVMHLQQACRNLLKHCKPTWSAL